MSEAALPTDILVSSQIRRAASQGVSIVVVKKGDSFSGSIILKINMLNGTARVLSQVRDEEKTAWTPLTATSTCDDREADKILAEQSDFDPDCWLIEIEDKQGRLWFDGDILE